MLSQKAETSSVCAFHQRILIPINIQSDIQTSGPQNQNQAA